jgi:hypothetical protein
MACNQNGAATIVDHDTGSVDKYRSRVVAKGFHQKEGVDYTDVFAPGSNLVTLRMLLSIAVKEDLEVHQLDV